MIKKKEKQKIRKDVQEKLDYMDSLLADINPQETRKWLSKFKHKTTSIDKPTTDKPTKSKGSKQKRIRNIKWDVFEFVQDRLIEEEIRNLIFLKSYIAGTPQDNDGLYICQVLGISTEDSRNIISRIPEFFEYTNKCILHFITLLNGILKMIPKFLEEKPSKIKQKKMWFIDIFGEQAKYYLPDWEKYKRKSHNLPDYNKSSKIVTKFLEPTPATKLGYLKTIKKDDGTHKKRRYYHHFYLRHGPQGQIKMLHMIHILLNWRNIEKKLNLHN
jgi:hypothetical protein